MSSYYSAITTRWDQYSKEQVADSESHLYSQTAPILSENGSTNKSSILSHIGKRVVDTLKPSFLSHSPQRKIGPTAYLDGLRGFSAFLVYWQHHQVWARVGIEANHIFENGYGYKGQYYFACLPFIRTFFTGGHFAVACFFVISGFVLSTKSMSLIHAGDIDGLSKTLSSALFRRWLRLYIPCICTTFLYMMLWHGPFNVWTAYPDHQANLWEEIKHWYIEFKQFSFVFRMGGKDGLPWFTYNFHLWSIPVEFKGSILVYTSLQALSRCSRNARLWIQVAMIIYCIYIVEGACHLAMFAAGMLLSDLDLLAKAENLPRFLTRLGQYKSILTYIALAVSIYLSGVPSHNPDIQVLRETPGWYHLSYLYPSTANEPKSFYLFFAAIALVWCIPHLPWLKTFFEYPLNQYLGRISFALYLVHGPILWSLGDRMYLAVGWTRPEHIEGLKQWINLWPVSKAGPLGLEFAFWVPHLVILPFTLWLAEVVTRVFDEGSVRFAQWVYRISLPAGER